jgi:hypothetical protein
MLLPLPGGGILSDLTENLAAAEQSAAAFASFYYINYIKLFTNSYVGH